MYNTKNLDELLDSLGWIALHKRMLPRGLRGWVNALGLFVQERKAGRWTRLQAGGSLRSYLDAWQEDEGEWQIKKFDKATWERRFAHVVQPTVEIADFLSERATYFGDLDNEGAAVLNGVLQRYKSTGQWPGLPRVSEDVKLTWAEEEVKLRGQEEREKRLRQISDLEKRVRADPFDRHAWGSLHLLYYHEERFKDLENALKKSLQTDASELGFQYSINYKALGKTYLAALANSIRGEGIPIWGYTPSNVRAEELGYSIEELRALAQQNLFKANEMDKQAGFGEEDLREIDLALRCATDISPQAFEAFDKYKEQQRQQEEERWKDL